MYSWGPSSAIVSGGTSSMPIVSINEDTEITFMAIDPTTGCTFDTSFLLLHSDIVAAILADPGTTINRGEDVSLIVETDGINVTYMWSDPSLTGAIVTVMPEQDATYTVTVTDENGCSVVASINITVRQPMCNEIDVFLPNAFTPNGDGVNDVLFVRSNFVKEMTLIIYNRWGQEVFRSNDQSVGWDGTFRNEPLTSDTYGFFLNVICIDDVQYTTKGNISLIR